MTSKMLLGCVSISTPYWPSAWVEFGGQNGGNINVETNLSLFWMKSFQSCHHPWNRFFFSCASREKKSTVWSKWVLKRWQYANLTFWKLASMPRIHGVVDLSSVIEMMTGFGRPANIFGQDMKWWKDFNWPIVFPFLLFVSIWATSLENLFQESVIWFDCL